MAKTIVPITMIGPTFMEVLFREIVSIATEKEKDPAEIQGRIVKAGDIAEVNNILNEYFDGELKIRE